MAGINRENEKICEKYVAELMKKVIFPKDIYDVYEV